MNVVLTAFLTLLNAILPTLTVASSGTIQNIISALITLIPLAAKEYQDVLPMIRNIVAALKGNSEVTPEQLDQLDEMEAQLDAAFDAAAQAAQAEDNAAGNQ